MLAIVLATRTIPLTGIAIIPIAGIIVGNAMTAHTLVGRRAFAALREEHAQYEACLSLGPAARARPSARSSTAARPRPCCPAWTRSRRPGS